MRRWHPVRRVSGRAGLEHVLIVPMSARMSHFSAAAAGWRAWPRRVLAWPVRAYRLLLSPWLGSSCRFEPTCSRYALQALDQHGAAAGAYLTATRIVRCHPWCDGGVDAVPAARPRLFRHLFPGASGPTDPSAPASSLSSTGPLS